MISDDELLALPDDPTLAFLVYEEKLRAAMQEQKAAEGWVAALLAALSRVSHTIRSPAAIITRSDTVL